MTVPEAYDISIYYFTTLPNSTKSIRFGPSSWDRSSVLRMINTKSKSIQKSQCVLMGSTFHGRKEKENPVSYIYNVKFLLLSTYLDVCGRTQNKEIDRVHERALRLLFNDYTLSFEELLQKSR